MIFYEYVDQMHTHSPGGEGVTAKAEERETAACGTGEEIEERQTDRQAGKDDHAWSEDQGCAES